MAKQLNVSLNFTADTQQAKAQMQELQRQLNALSTTANIPVGKRIKDDILGATKAAAELKTTLNSAINAETGKLDLTKFSTSLKSSGKDLQYYRQNLQKLGPEGSQAFLNLATAIQNAEAPLLRTNSLLGQMWTTMKNTARWQISSSVLHSIQGAFSSALGYAKDLNESLNDIRIVTGQSVEQMAEFAKEANKAAKNLGTTTTRYTDAALIYYQQGLSDSEVQERTDATIKMANVTGENATDVSSYMTAIWNNFDDGSKSIEYFADVITKLGAETAASSAEIAGGLEKFAAIGETVGLSYEYATAALTTIIDKTRQSEDVVGTALKTIFARIQGLKMGGETEDGLDLNKYSSALAQYGIEIFDANRNLRDMDDILDDMGEKWNSLNRAQKVGLAQTVAGVRQYNQLVSLMDNWDAMQDNLAMAEGAEGSLTEQAKIYEESWEAASNRVRASLEELYSSIIDDEFFIDMTNFAADAVNTIDSVVEGLGGVKGMLLLISSIITTKLGPQMAQGLTSMAMSIGDTFTKGSFSTKIRQDAATEVAELSKTSGLKKEEVQYYQQIGSLTKTYENNVHKMSELEKSVNLSLIERQKILQKNSIEIDNQIKAREEEYGLLSRQNNRRYFSNPADANRQEVQNLLNKLRNYETNYTGKNDFNIDKIGQRIIQLADSDTGNDSVGYANAVDREIREIEQLLTLKRTQYKNQRQVNKAYQDGTKIIKESSGAYQYWATSMVQAVQALSQLGMALTAANSIKNVLTNEDLTPWERFIQISTSLPMLITGLSGSFNTLLPIIKSLNLANSMYIILQTAKIKLLKEETSLETIQILVDALITKGIDAQTAAIIANHIAHGRLIKALQTLLGVKASLLLSFTLLVAGIAAAVAIIDIFTISQKEANKSIKEATEAYDAEKQKLDELKSSLEEVNQQIDELNNKGVLSITDKNELTRLKQQKQLLEQQIAIQEKLANKAQENQAKEIAKNFDSSLKWMNSRPQDKTYHKGGEEFTIKATQDQIDEWITKHSEDISAAEQNFINYMAAVNAGLVELDQNVINSLAEMRHFIYDDNEYYEIFIKPTLMNEELKDIAVVFSQGGELDASQQELFNRIAANAGITSEELKTNLTESVNRISDAIETGILDPLTADDLELMIALGWVDEESKSYIEKILELKKNGVIQLDIATKYDFDSDTEIDDYLKNNTNIERDDLDVMTDLSVSENDQEKIKAFKNSQEDRVENKRRKVNSIDEDRDRANYQEKKKSVEDYKKALNDAEKSEERYNKLLQRSAAATARQSKGIEDLNKNFATNAKILKNETLKGTTEYAQALSDTRNSLADLLNVDASNLPVSFLESEENIKLMEQALQGSDSAFEQLRQNAAQSIIANLDIQENSEFAVQDVQNNLTGLLDWLDQADFGIDSYVDIDDTDFYDTINKMLADGVITADQLTQVLSSAGYVGEIVNEDVTPTPTDVKYNIVGSFGDQEYDGSITVTQEVSEPLQIPVLKGAYQTGGISRNVSAVKAKSSGSKTKIDKIDKTKKSDIVDRYKEINDSLEDQSKLLDKINDQTDRLYGKDKIDSLKKANAEIEKENKLLKKKQKEAKEYLKEDKKSLQNTLDKARKKAGLKESDFKFDKDGDIKNYESQMTALYKKLNAAETDYNKKYAGKTETEASKAAKKKVEELQDIIDALRDTIEQYDETKVLIEELDEQVQDNLNEIQDNNFEALTHEIELRVTINENDKKALDFAFSSISEDVYKASEALALIWSDTDFDLIDQATQALDNNSFAITRLKEDYEAGKISKTDYLEKMQEEYDSIFDNVEALQELDEQMKEYYGNTLDMAIEEISKYTDHMDSLTSVLDHYKSILELTGRGQNYDAMDKILQGQAKTLKNNYDVAKKNYEMLLKEKETVEARIKTMDVTSAGYEMEKEKLDKLIAETDAAYDEMLSDAESYLSVLQEIWTAALENIKEETEKALTGNMGFDSLMDSLNNLKDYQDEYLTKVNQEFEMQKLMSNVQRDIDKTNNVAAKQRLNNFAKEIEQLEEKDKLSNLELEIAQAKYKQLQAQIALEEAQNAKSVVRLSRDNEGNYGYVYTADQDAISEAEDELAQAENDLYNIRLNATNEYGEKMLQAEQEYLDAVAKAYQDYADDEEALRRELARLEEEYYNLIGGYSELYTIAQQEDTRVVRDAWINQYDDILGASLDWKTKLEEYVQAIEDKHEEWQAVAGPILDDLNLKTNNLAMAVNSVTTKSNEMKDALIKEGGVIDTLGTELSAVNNVTAAYEAQRDMIQEVIDKMLEKAKLIQAELKEESGVTGWNTHIGDRITSLKEEGKTIAQWENDQTGQIHYMSYDPNKMTEKEAEDALKKKYGTKKFNDAAEWNEKIANKLNGLEEPRYHGYDINGKYHYHKTREGLEKILKKYGGKMPGSKITYYDTGGYTGEWGPEGKLAMLHEKEIVLNKEDSANILKVVEIVRTMIDTNAANAGIGVLHSPGINTQNQNLEQTVTITAEFPNATDHNEIEMAFNSLINKATQFANRK